MQSIDEISIHQIQEMLSNKEISVAELVQEYLRRIDLYDQGPNKLNSILEINPDALSIAEKLDAYPSNFTSKLFGLPILLKDNMDTSDRMHTSAGSLALAESFASCDAGIVEVLRQKGGVILGKTNMTEFADHMTKGMKPGYSSRGGMVKSPYNENKNPGGSSTGSAVGVSANLCAVSLGTDTSGSITSPAIKNGIVGFRPSTSVLSQKGIIPISFTLDTAGTLTRTVMDSSILFMELINTLIDMDEANIKGTVIGIDQVTLENLTDEEEKKARTIIRTLEKSGATIKRVKIPKVPKNDLKQIQLYEFKYCLNRYLSERPRGSSIRSLKDIIEFNNLNPSKTLKYGQTLLIEAEKNTKGDLSEPVYKNLIKDREKTKKEVQEKLSEFDICIMFQENLILQYGGFPIITIPHGSYNDDMPYGIYLTALSDITLLKIAHRIEQAIGYRIVPAGTDKNHLH